jgi:hypothetical protein
MFTQKKPNTSSELPRARVRITSAVKGGSEPKAFSYYSSRRQSISESERVLGQSPRQRAPAQVSSRPLSFRRLSWYGIALLGICFGLFLLKEVLFLSSSASVRVVQSDVPAALPHTSERYRASVNQVLKSSVLNQFKPSFHTETIRTTLQNMYPELDRVEVQVPMIGRTPRITLVASSAKTTLIQGNTAYLLSNTGYVQAVMPSNQLAQYTNEKGMLRITDQSVAVPKVGVQHLPTRTMQFIQSLDYQLKYQQKDVETYILPANNAYEIMVRLKNKPYVIRYNLQEDATLQSGALAATLARLKGDSVIKTYVDLRVPGKVYYK